MTDTPNNLATLMRSRRTIHEFKPELPPRERIVEALELACWGPNHHLTEPWHYYLLGRQTANAIAARNAQLVAAQRGADAAAAKLSRWQSIPGWLAVTCDRSDDPQRQREDYAAVCCGIQNLSLYLWQAGIGVKWTTGAVTRDEQFYDLIWVDPQVETVVGLIWYGYPATVPKLLRKPLEGALVELP